MPNGKTLVWMAVVAVVAVVAYDKYKAKQG